MSHHRVRLADGLHMTAYQTPRHTRPPNAWRRILPRFKCCRGGGGSGASDDTKDGDAIRPVRGAVNLVASTCGADPNYQTCRLVFLNQHTAALSDMSEAVYVHLVDSDGVVLKVRDAHRNEHIREEGGKGHNLNELMKLAVKRVGMVRGLFPAEIGDVVKVVECYPVFSCPADGDVEGHAQDKKRNFCAVLVNEIGVLQLSVTDVNMIVGRKGSMGQAALFARNMSSAVDAPNVSSSRDVAKRDGADGRVFMFVYDEKKECMVFNASNISTLEHMTKLLGQLTLVRVVARTMNAKNCILLDANQIVHAVHADSLTVMADMFNEGVTAEGLQGRPLAAAMSAPMYSCVKALVATACASRGTEFTHVFSGERVNVITCTYIMNLEKEPIGFVLHWWGVDRSLPQLIEEMSTIPSRPDARASRVPKKRAKHALKSTRRRALSQPPELISAQILLPDSASTCARARERGGSLPDPKKACRSVSDVVSPNCASLAQHSRGADDADYVPMEANV